MNKPKKSLWEGVVRKFIGCAAVAGLAASLSAGAAFATDQTSTTYALPMADDVVSFQHEGTDDNGNKYTYEYVTIGSSVTARVAPMMQTYYEVLGLNYVNAYRGPDSIYATFNADGSANTSGGFNETYTIGDMGSLRTRNSSLAIMGSENNECPDEYMWNYCCWANGAILGSDRMALDHGNDSTIGTGKVNVTIGNAEYADFPREVYMECNIIGGTSSKAVSSTDSYGSDEVKAYSAWVDLENQRANRPKTGEYNPYYSYLNPTAGGGHTLVNTLHTLADRVDGIVAQTANANSNYQLQTRYGGNSASGTGASIDKFEDLVQATQYYTLSKIESGKVDKKVTALVVGYDPATGNYACRIYNAKSDKSFNNAGQVVDTATSDPETNYYGGRVANYLSSISTSITELGLTEAQEPYDNGVESNFVKWYTPEQIVENCDAVFNCDAPSDNKISQYLGTASDGKTYVVYSPATVGSPEEDRTAGLTQAAEAAESQGKNVASFCFSYPATMFGNFYAQGVENGMLALITSSFTYPDVFTSNGLTNLLGYWAKNVWHVKTNKLQSVVEGTCSYMSLQGLSLGRISNNFESEAEALFKEGNTFYIQHKNEIDALNGGNLATYDINKLIARTDSSLTANSGAALTKALAAADLKAIAITGTTSYSKTVGDAAFKLDAAAANGAALSYSSSDTNVATVDASGNVTVKGAGTAIVTASVARNGNQAANALQVTIAVAQGKQTVTASNVTKTFGTAAFALGAKTSGDGKLTYASSNAKVATVSSAGKVTIKGAGSAKITVTAAETANYAKAYKTVTLTVNKAAQPMTAKAKAVTVKVGKSVAASKMATVKKAQGAVSYAKTSGNGKITVKGGKLAVKKGLKPGSYKIKVKVTAKGNANYKSGSKNITVTVKVKK